MGAISQPPAAPLSLPWRRAVSGAALEGLAEARYLQREYSASAAGYERAYSAYRREGQIMAAGRAARTAAWITGNVLGDWGPQRLAGRARSLLEEAGEDGTSTAGC